MPDQKLVGQNYTPPDLVAKVTGRAKYAEDYRVDGMLFAKLLLSPMPHARVVGVDTRAALAMPGVKAILTADDLPDQRGAERALTNEPLYQGEPILAVAAIDELTAAEAIERIEVRLRAAAVRHRSDRKPAAGRRQRRGPKATSGIRRRRRAPRRRRSAAAAEAADAEMDRTGFRRRARGRAADGEPRPTSGRTATSTPASRAPRSSSTKRSSCSRPAISRWKRAARWPTGRTASCTSTDRRRASRGRSIRWQAGWRWTPPNIVLVSEYCGGGFGSKGAGAVSMIVPALLSKKAGAPVMMRISREEEHLLRPGAHGHGRPRQSRVQQGRPHHRARPLHRRRQRSVRADGRLPVGRHRRVAHLAAAGDALARRRGASPTRRRDRSSARRARCRRTRSWSRSSPRRRRSWASTSSRSGASTRPKAKRSTDRRARTASAATSRARS